MYIGIVASYIISHSTSFHDNAVRDALDLLFSNIGDVSEIVALKAVQLHVNSRPRFPRLTLMTLIPDRNSLTAPVLVSLARARDLSQSALSAISPSFSKSRLTVDEFGQNGSQARQERDTTDTDNGTDTQHRIKQPESDHKVHKGIGDIPNVCTERCNGSRIDREQVHDLGSTLVL